MESNYEVQKRKFENAYNAVMGSGCSKVEAQRELTIILARFANGRGFAHRVHPGEAPVLNGQAYAYREILDA